MKKAKQITWWQAVILVVTALLAVTLQFWRKGAPAPLVVYCAHDSIYSEAILQQFERKTGIPVNARFDTEATKSLGLVELLIREKDSPRCDVFWNNELLGTLDLQERGMLLPYTGPGYERIPPAFRDPEGHWVGFGARLRVYIVNTEKMRPSDEAVEGALQGDLSRAAIAKPLYGTTLTHYSVLWHLWGPEKAKSWHRDWRSRRIQEVTGNATVKNLVARGVCDFGLTDSDDFFIAKDEGMPVAMLPARVETGAVICIPNTAAVIKGTRRPEEAKKLVDFLASEECELALAGSRSRQIPLGPVDGTRLTDEVKELREWARSGYPLPQLAAARNACLAWLKEEYVR